MLLYLSQLFLLLPLPPSTPIPSTNSPISSCPWVVAAFQIPSLSLNFGILIMMCLCVVLFESNLFENLCASWTCMSISFIKLGKFSFIMFSISCTSSSPSSTPMILMLACLKLSQKLLAYAHFLKFFFLLAVLIE